MNLSEHKTAGAVTNLKLALIPSSTMDLVSLGATEHEFERNSRLTLMAERDDTDIALDDELLAEAFELSQQAAESAVHNLTPIDVLGEFMPRIAPSTTNSSSAELSSTTPPTSMSIHNEAAADVSEDATLASTEDNTLLWGLGASFEVHEAPQEFVKKPRVQRRRSYDLPAFSKLPPWAQLAVLAGISLCLASAFCCAQVLAQALSSHLRHTLSSEATETFQSWYFSTVPRMSPWKRVAALVNGFVWLVSLFHPVVPGCPRIDVEQPRHADQAPQDDVCLAGIFGSRWIAAAAHA